MWVLLSSLILYGYQWRFSFSGHLMHKYTQLYFGKIKYGQNTFSVIVGKAIIIKTPLISTLPQPWLHELSINCQGGKMINKPFLWKKKQNIKLCNLLGFNDLVSQILTIALFPVNKKYIKWRIQFSFSKRFLF